MKEVTVRRMSESDVPAVTEILNYYVEHTPITFDLEPHTVESRLDWFRQFRESGPHQCFVAEHGGSVAGYACSTQFRKKAAYDVSVETTVYLRHGDQGGGIGSRLYRVLFEALAAEDVHRAVAGVTLPNEASVSLHEKFGFSYVGNFTEIGRKFDRYWDVAWYIKDMTR